jgi:DNA-binding CsgD family transcriptional regulator
VETLTPREQEIVRLAARGLSDRQLGLALGISTPTVKKHLQAARRKTGLRNRTELAVFALETGLAPSPGRKASECA